MLSKRARETRAKKALKDMIPPTDPLSEFTEGERDLNDLFNDSMKKGKRIRTR